MAVTNLATAVSATGVSAAVAVPASRCYVVQMSVSGSVIQIRGSLDGTNFFDMNTGVKLSNTTGWAYRFLDQQVTHMQVVTSTYGGTPFDVKVMDI